VLASGEVAHSTKLCVKCGETKPLDEFSVKVYGVSDGQRYPRGFSTHCRSCIKEYRAHYYDRNQEDFNQKNKEYRTSDPAKYNREQSKRYLRKSLRKYGLTVDDYQRLYDAQQGKCEICGTHQDRLVIDHCHATGRMRGLLCRLCNAGLGYAKDNPHVLRRMIRYLNDSATRARRTGVELPA
jgi:hypothetical protein